MKVRMLIDVGLHSVGSIVDIEDSYVMQLERDGTAIRLGSEPVVEPKKEVVEVPVIKKAPKVITRKKK